MAVPFLSFDAVSHHAGHDFVETNLEYEHRNVDQETGTYPKEVILTISHSSCGFTSIATDDWFVSF